MARVMMRTVEEVSVRRWPAAGWLAVCVLWACGGESEHPFRAESPAAGAAGAGGSGVSGSGGRDAQGGGGMSAGDAGAAGDAAASGGGARATGGATGAGGTESSDEAGAAGDGGAAANAGASTAGGASGNGGVAGSAGMSGAAGAAGSAGSMQMCPLVPPGNGGSCPLSLLSKACYYEDCAGAGRTRAACVTIIPEIGNPLQVWEVESAPCGEEVQCLGSAAGDTCGADELCLVRQGGALLVDCVKHSCGSGPVGCDCVEGCSGDCYTTGTTAGLSIVCNTCSDPRGCP